ncbi:MAG: DUF4267 domain-containing protein [Caulobacteraceae bacterium]|nr:DUF4267 domain-containing protein [Caulobacter sp.]
MLLVEEGVAWLAALAIIGIGVGYVAVPAKMMASFGLPLPADVHGARWWLRPKGVRDIVSGLVVIAVVFAGDRHLLGLVLMVEALIPLGDMATVLLGKGRVPTALGVHGLTALVMLAAAAGLLAGAAR